MPATYTCECQGGRSLTGNARWTPAELKQMNPLQLAQVLSEVRDFAQYYLSNFYYPAGKLEQECQKIRLNFESSRKWAFIGGLSAGTFTLLWLLLAAIPVFRYSGLTLAMAIFTLCSIVLFIPILFRYMSAQEDHNKRYPRLTKKLEQLTQKQEKEIFGTYLDDLISGYVVSTEYYLYPDGLEFMIHALRTRRASNLAEAALLCRKKLGRSPIPKIITALRSIGQSEDMQAEPVKKEPPKPTITQLQNQTADLSSVLLLSDYLNTALRNYAATQPNPGDSLVKELNKSEELLLAEFRALTDDEKKRIQRVVHSFYTKQY